MNLKNNLQEKLEFHYQAFDRTTIEPDPLQFPHQFKNKRDIEFIAFISSIFAYGSVNQIINTLNKIINILGKEPVNYLININENKIKNDFKNIIHRFYSNEDIIKLLLLLKHYYSNNKYLKDLFYLKYNPNEKNIKNALEYFSLYFLTTNKALFNTNKITFGINFMFPLPSKGSACKRMNLLLRWMVRKDELDFGIWDKTDKSKLVIPVDTHIARICTQLKLTKRKNISWQMAEEITDNLKLFDKNDPVKYDFAICHIGMRKLRF